MSVKNVKKIYFYKEKLLTACNSGFQLGIDKVCIAFS